MTDETDYWYILCGREVVPAASARQWAEWYDKANRRIGRDEIGVLVVSTIFLGLDHRFFDDGPPLVFETIIFDDDCGHDLETFRYATYDQAEAGHKAACEIARRMIAGADALIAGPRESPA